MPGAKKPEPWNEKPATPEVIDKQSTGYCKTSLGLRKGMTLVVPNQVRNRRASAPEVRPWPSAAKAAILVPHLRHG